MHFTNNPLDNRESSSKKPSKSIIEVYTEKLRKRFNDPSLDQRMVAKILQNLSEKDIEDFADYACRKANHPGRAFVKLCHNVMQYKTLS